MQLGRKNSLIIIIFHYYCRLIARANRTRKSRYSIFPPTGTRAKYMSKLIKHNALPFIGNFCANSGVGSSPSDNDKFISHCHTCARVQSRGSEEYEHRKQKQLILDSPQEHEAASDAANYSPMGNPSEDLLASKPICRGFGCILCHRCSVSRGHTLTFDKSNGGTRPFHLFNPLSTCIL